MKTTNRESRAFPLIHRGEHSPMFLLDTAIALAPPFFMACFYYGLRSLAVGAVTVAAAILTNGLCSLLSGKGLAWWDASPLVSGMIIALLMPASVPFYVPVTAAIFAMVVVKFPFGGTGNNLFNPAAGGLCFAIICFGELICSYPVPLEPLPITVDGSVKLVQGAAALLKMGAVPSLSTQQLMLGNFAGPMGATNLLVLGACLVYLLVRRTVQWYVPATYLATVSLFAGLIHHEDLSYWQSIVLELVAGGLMFAAVYMLTEPVTLPKRPMARLMYALLAGTLTMLFRYYGAVTFSAPFALLLCNAFGPLLDRVAELPYMLGEEAPKR